MTDNQYLNQLQAAVTLSQIGKPGLAMTVADDLLPERITNPPCGTPSARSRPTWGRSRRRWSITGAPSS